MPPNQYILASDNSPELLPLLRSKPELASQQDEHGYSLIHAAASYNHLDLLRTLVREFHVPVDLRDEDEETALFVVETVEAARCLVEELGLDLMIRGSDGMTAAEKIASDGDFPLVAEYLASHQVVGQGWLNALNDIDSLNRDSPNGMKVTFGTMTEPAAGKEGEASGSATTNADQNSGPDPEFRQRIEELAARPDFHEAQGQAALRQLVEDVLSQQNKEEERNVRPRQE